MKTVKDKVREQIIAEYSRLFSLSEVSAQDLRVAVVKILDSLSEKEKIRIESTEKEKIIAEILNDFLGFGPIDGLMKDPEVTEIMINGPKKVFVERWGRTELSGITFEGEKDLMHLVHKILAPTRRRVDEVSPYVDVSLEDGSRVNIIIPPLALNGPVITIRKFLRTFKKIEDLIAADTLDRRMADFLIACVRAKINIIFSGATGVGKTTTLGILSSYINDEERIITIEDTAELQLDKPNLVRLETKMPTLEGKGEVTTRDLFKNSLRMRPERIILGEIRGAEALDMLQAICSGHAGSLAVLHANSPQEVIYRLETMILTSGFPIGLEIIHRQMAAALDIIVHQEQLLDGSRKITYLTQINGLTDGQINLEDIFLYDIEKVTSPGKILGRWKATGIIPKFYQRFEKKGISLPREIFNKD